MLELLLDYFADVDAQDAQGTTALMWATDRNNIKLVKLLLDNFADISVKDNDGKTAQDWAKKKGYKDIFHLLSFNHLDNGFWQYFVFGSKTIYNGMKIVIPERFLKIY